MKLNQILVRATLFFKPQQANQVNNLLDFLDRKVTYSFDIKIKDLFKGLVTYRIMFDHCEIQIQVASYTRMIVRKNGSQNIYKENLASALSKYV
jgi:hypothetical protein